MKKKTITEKVHDIKSLAKHLNINVESLFIYPEHTIDKHERYINACNILPKIAAAYNEGKVLNWKNNKEYKYLPYLYYYNDSAGVLFRLWSYRLHFPAGFYFININLAQEAYNNFKKYYIDFWGNSPD